MNSVFYLMIAMNGLATLAFIFCYHPPTFHAKHGARSKLDFIKHFDYLGTFIIVLGLLLFLMGLSWGGTVYPWRSAHVIACMVIGALLTIAFFAYEALLPLKEPLLPMYLLKNRGWDVTIVIWAIGAGVYYANALLWPGMVNSMYAGGHGPMWIGWMSCIPNCGILFGEYCSAWYRKNTNWQICVFFSLGALFLGCKCRCGIIKNDCGANRASSDGNINARLLDPLGHFHLHCFILRRRCRAIELHRVNVMH